MDDDDLKKVRDDLRRVEKGVIEDLQQQANYIEDLKEGLKKQASYIEGLKEDLKKQVGDIEDLKKQASYIEDLDRWRRCATRTRSCGASWERPLETCFWLHGV